MRKASFIEEANVFLPSKKNEFLTRGKKQDSRSAYSACTPLVLRSYSAVLHLYSARTPLYSTRTPSILRLYSAVLCLYSAVLCLYSAVLRLYSACTPLYSVHTPLVLRCTPLILRLDSTRTSFVAHCTLRMWRLQLIGAGASQFQLPRLMAYTIGAPISPQGLYCRSTHRSSRPIL
jgi:hypothetical protein